MQKPSYFDYMHDEEKTLADYLRDYVTYQKHIGNPAAKSFDVSRLDHLTSTSANDVQEWLQENDNDSLMHDLFAAFPDLVSDTQASSDPFSTELAILHKMRYRDAISNPTSRGILGASCRPTPMTASFVQSQLERSLKVAIFTALQHDNMSLLDSFIEQARSNLQEMEIEMGDEVPRRVQALKDSLRETVMLQRVMQLPHDDFIRFHNQMIDTLCDDLSEDSTETEAGIRVLYRHYATDDDAANPVPGLAALFIDLQNGDVLPVGIAYHSLLKDDFEDEFNEALNLKAAREFVMSQTMEYMNANRDDIVKFFATKRLGSNDEGELWAGHVTVKPQTQVPNPGLVRRLLHALKSSGDEAAVSESDIDSFIDSVLKEDN